MLEWKKGYYRVYIGFLWWNYMAFLLNMKGCRWQVYPYLVLSTGVLKFNFKHVLEITAAHDLYMQNPKIGHKELDTKMVSIWMKTKLFISLMDRISNCIWDKLSGYMKHRSQNTNITATGKCFATGILLRLCNYRIIPIRNAPHWDIVKGASILCHFGHHGALIVCFDIWRFKQVNNSETGFGGHHCDCVQHVPCITVHVCMNFVKFVWELGART